MEGLSSWDDRTPSPPSLDLNLGVSSIASGPVPGSSSSLPASALQSRSLSPPASRSQSQKPRRLKFQDGRPVLATAPSTSNSRTDSGIGETKESKHLSQSLKAADSTRLRFWVRKLRDELVLEAAWARRREAEYAGLLNEYHAQRGELLLGQATIKQLRGVSERARISQDYHDAATKVTEQALRMAGNTSLSAQQQKTGLLVTIQQLRKENTRLEEETADLLSNAGMDEEILAETEKAATHERDRLLAKIDGLSQENARLSEQVATLCAQEASR